MRHVTTEDLIATLCNGRDRATVEAAATEYDRRMGRSGAALEWRRWANPGEK